MGRSRTTLVLLGTLLGAGSRAPAADKDAPHGLGLLAGRAADAAALQKLRSGLGDGRSEVRAAAVRVINVSGVGALVPAVRDALATEGDPVAASEMIRFLTALNRPELDAVAIGAARRLGAPVHQALADGLARRGDAAASHVPALRELRLDAEAWGVFHALAPGADPSGGPAAPAPVVPGVRTAGGFPPGFVRDVVRSSGCEFKGLDRIHGGEVTYGTDGRPRNVGLIQRGASEPCVNAVRALLVSTLAPVGIPTKAEQKSLVLVPDQPEFVACLDEAARMPPARALRPGSEDPKVRIEEPKKTRDLKPHYPEAAQTMRTQGVVILDAAIAPSGCVHQVSLLRGADTSLDLEAIRAVSGWGYAPTLLDGRAVPITMTVTVNFRLAR